MSKLESFKSEMEAGYTFSGSTITLGAAMLDGESTGIQVKAPLKSFTRHGLIAGATGTGKTKSLQVFAEQLSAAGVPVMLMDIKGDLSGVAKPGEASDKLSARNAEMGLEYNPAGNPVELMSISELSGVKLKATVLEFGPILFAKILELNDTQQGILSVMFRYCDQNGLPLLDLKDVKQVLNFMTNEGKDAIAAEYGSISPASVGTIMRKIVELEQQGAERFFGEPSFEVEDLMRLDDKGHGYVNVLQVMDMQTKPKLFSTFMLSLLAELYATLPEAGDLDKPKLVLFIDEAHLIFNEASDALLDQIESIIKLIRSKGVGIFFVTQNPSDIPDAVLSQLGLKAQHALRAFTAKDRKMIKMTAQNYPLTEYYDTAEMLTSLGIGEALVTVLDEQGRPTPLAATKMRAPESRMSVLTADEITALVSASQLVERYNKDIDRESAYEILRAKVDSTAEPTAAEEGKEKKTEKEAEAKQTAANEKEEPSALESLTNNTMVKQMGRTVVRELSRGLLGALGLGGTRRRTNNRRGGGWF